MKFSQVFVVLSVLFAISFGVPANWKEHDDLMLSNGNAVQKKRALPLVVVVLAKEALLGAAIKAVCNWGNLPDAMKGLCYCASRIVSSDEESEAEERKRLVISPLSILNSTFTSICNSALKNLLAKPCDCLKPFLQ